MMNPLYQNQSDELFFQLSSLDFPFPIQTIPEDQILSDPLNNTTCVHYKSQTGKGKPRKQDDNGSNKDESKKWMRRQIERQRRQEMNTLCASLRSLLPLEYIKGKRATSDQMNGAVNYIQHLQNQVKELVAKRDKLMKLCSLSSVGPAGVGSFATNLPIFVAVHPCFGGVEITCSYSFNKYVFPMSRLLDILLRESLQIVSCTFSKADERFMHTIKSEVSDMARIDFSELQRKLTEAVSSSSFAKTV